MRERQTEREKKRETQIWCYSQLDIDTQRKKKSLSFFFFLFPGLTRESKISCVSTYEQQQNYVAKPPYILFPLTKLSSLRASIYFTVSTGHISRALTFLLPRFDGL